MAKRGSSAIQELSRDDIQELLGDSAKAQRAELQKIMESTLKTFSDQAAASYENRFSAIAASVNQRFADVHKRTDAMEERQQSLEAMVQSQQRLQTDLTQTVRQIQHDLGAAQHASRPTAPISLEYVREIDTTILKLRAMVPVAKDAVSQGLAPLARSAGIQDNEWQVQGDAISKTFKVSFSGNPLFAARKASKFHRAQRDAEGAWQPLHVLVPGEPEARVFLDFDKSPATIALERASKKLRTVIEESTDIPIILRRRDHTVFTKQWEPVAKLVSEAPGDVRIQWCLASALATQLRQDGLEEKFSAATADPGDAAQWV